MKTRNIVNVGQRFGRVVVIEAGIARRGGLGTAARCVCDCGKIWLVRQASLVRGEVRGCGCGERHRRPRHGHAMSKALPTASPTYRSWTGMVGRCHNPRNKEWAAYGGRGITVCDRWRDFAAFLADMGERPHGTSIDRIDNNRGYEPGNCRWATVETQNRNRRSVKVTVAIASDIRSGKYAHMKGVEVSRLLGISQMTVSNIRNGKTWKVAGAHITKSREYRAPEAA